jgi:hypothetical protein
MTGFLVLARMARLGVRRLDGAFEIPSLMRERKLANNL